MTAKGARFTQDVDDGDTVVKQHDRTAFLGASDAAAVLGLSPYLTPVQLWQLKTGRAKPDESDPHLQRMRERGHKLEPFIVDMTIDKLRDEYGLEVELLARNQRYHDPEYPFLSCEIDFELSLTGRVSIGGNPVEFAGEVVNADAKSVTGFARRKWGDIETEDCPIEYATQFMTGLMLAPGQRQHCLVAALRSFDDVDIYWTVRDDETIAAMRAKLVQFWIGHVLADVAPDPMIFDDIKALFPTDNGLAIEANDDIAEAVRELIEVKAHKKVYEEREEVLKTQIGDYIRPNARLTYHGIDLMSFKGQNDTRVDITELKQAMPDVYQRFCNTKVIRVLRHVKPFTAKGRKS